MEKELNQSIASLTIDQIIDTYSDDLYHFCRHLTRNKGDADDLFQDTWMKVVKKLDSYDAEQNFKNWLYKIALNTYRDWYRKFQRQSLISAWLSSEEKDKALNQVASNDYLPETECLRNEEYQTLYDAVCHLKDKYRLPIVLFYFNDLPQKAIAEMLDIPEGTVKSRLSKGKAILNERLGGDDNGSIRYHVT